jgi:hypothetical protein
MTVATDIVFDTIVPAKPAGLWTLVIGFITGPVLLRFSAPPDICWSYADDLDARCGPDGDPNSLLDAATCLVPTAPVGALVAKIGGSSAGVSDDGTTFVVGSRCVYRVTKTSGPLYLTINDARTAMGNNAGQVTVTIWISPVTESAPGGTLAPQLGGDAQK